ncbi:MAG TPA: DUF1801 domain-containing protein [Nannocystaceae bacterium]|nr:DUF1801 domain-containing protein [Nannocystaceae bacterium]
MKGQLAVTTPEDYLAAVAPERRADIAALHALIREVAPTLPPFICSGMLGYGPIHYKYASGREGDTARLALASNAQYISLYAMAADERGYVAEHFKERLPKASIGKACVRFKRLADLDLAALRDLVRETVEIGLPGVDGPAPPSTRKSTATKPTSKTKPASTLATKSAAASPAEPTKSSTGKLAAKPSASSKSAPKPPAKSSAKPPAKPSSKPPAKSSSKPPAKSSAKPPAKPAKSSAKPPAKPAKVSPTSSAAPKAAKTPSAKPAKSPAPRKAARRA